MSRLLIGDLQAQGFDVKSARSSQVFEVEFHPGELQLYPAHMDTFCDFLIRPQISTLILSFSTTRNLVLPCPQPALRHPLCCQHFSVRQKSDGSSLCDQSR